LSDNILKFDPSILFIPDTRLIGKQNTEIFLAVIPILLLVLVGVGFLLQKRKATNSLKVVLLTMFLSMNLGSRVNAVCPVCTVAVGAGLGFSRYYHIDDMITSLWMGGLVISTIYWIINWLAKRKIKSQNATSITFIIMYALVFIPLWIGDTIGVKYNTLWGIDKVLLGITLGSIAFYIGMKANDGLKKKNGGKVYIPFQRVVMPVLALWLTSLIFYFIIYYFV